jgi:hypothetical protein
MDGPNDMPPAPTSVILGPITDLERAVRASSPSRLTVRLMLFSLCRGNEPWLVCGGDNRKIDCVRVSERWGSERRVHGRHDA